MSKLDKSTVLYFGPESVAVPEGTHCGVCWKFVGDAKGKGTCVEVKGSIDGPKGTCGLYVHGEPFKYAPMFKVTQVSKEEAGYQEKGPTHCHSCEYMLKPDEKTSMCKNVEGVIHQLGCCNGHDFDKKRKLLDVRLEDLGL